MTGLVAVTGATGNIGAAVAARLLEAGIRVRAIARSADRLRRLTAAGAEPRVGDLADRRFLASALRGADAVFAMIPQHLDAPDYMADQRRLVEGVTSALADSGVRRVVALSAAGARSRIGLPALLWEFQERLQALSGVPVLVLQPTYFMENFLAAIPMVRGAGVMGGAVRGDVAVPMIATRDVAATAAASLEAASFTGYSERPLLGPRACSFREASAILGAAIERPDLPYVDLSEEQAREGMLGAGLSASAVDAYLAMVRAVNDRPMRDGPAPDPSQVMPTTIEAFAREVFAPAFRRSV